MTLKKRREWARAFIGARRHGFSRLELILFSIACAWKTGSTAPFVVVLRVVLRVEPTRERKMWPVRHVPTTWPPRVLGALAVSIALWGMLALYPEPIRTAPSPEWPMPEHISTDWLTRDGGAIAVPMPPKRLERQQAPPCLPPPGGQVEINGGCWFEMVGRPPCGQLYEHAGKCYVPVREMPRPPTSVDP